MVSTHIFLVILIPSFLPHEWQNATIPHNCNESACRVAYILGCFRNIVIKFTDSQHEPCSIFFSFFKCFTLCKVPLKLLWSVTIIFTINQSIKTHLYSAICRKWIRCYYYYWVVLVVDVHVNQWIEPPCVWNCCCWMIQIYVRSTDYERTLMSAESNLAGLFPLQGAQVWNDKLLWQPVPVHTVPQESDRVSLHKQFSDQQWLGCLWFAF